ncbi:fumarate hydratase [Thiotrichales bacterium 19S9-12]|nr:fumarate hydratase [Thiotrichales bacterium 19S9-11]MCF6811048.1 fumarate hydratase [Thiotrichales bacterium 19S9-12]
MTLIKTEDLIESINNACQYISYYHPIDFIDSLHNAYKIEKNPAAKEAMAQILINSKMAAEGKRPICQDTGMICVFVKVGLDVKFDRTDLSITDLVNEGVRRAYTNKDNPLRASMLTNPASKRTNTKDNTPAIVHVDLIPGNTIDIKVAAKGGGSEFKSKFSVLNPSDSIIDWVLEMVPKMGAGWCPPGMLGIGIGGTAEQAMLLAKESLYDSIDMPELLQRGPSNDIEKLRIDLYHKVNDLGIGAQGLGGLTTVLDIKIKDYPTHAATLPIAMIPNCAATRHIHFTLDGRGPAKLEAPSLSDWPEIALADQSQSKRINLDAITKEEVLSLKAGETVLLSGKMLTGRDAAHKRIVEMVKSGQALPVDLKGRFIYYVGPVDPVRDEVVGPAGPTTATRMDKFTDFMLKEVGIMGMVGKAERGDQAVEAIKANQGIYLMAVGGSAYLISKRIKSAKVVAFEDLGMEAIYEFEVEDMPVTVAVDSLGASVHKDGPKEWKLKIEKLKINQ